MTVLQAWSQIGGVPTEHALYRTPGNCSVQCSGLRNDVARKFVAVSNVVLKRYCADLCLHAINPCLAELGVISLIKGPERRIFAQSNRSCTRYYPCGRYETSCSQKEGCWQWYCCMSCRRASHEPAAQHASTPTNTPSSAIRTVSTA